MNNLIDDEDQRYRSIPYIITIISIVVIAAVLMQIALVGYMCYYIVAHASSIIDSIGSTISEVSHTHNVCVNEYYLYKCSAIHHGSGNY